MNPIERRISLLHATAWYWMREKELYKDIEADPNWEEFADKFVHPTVTEIPRLRQIQFERDFDKLGDIEDAKSDLDDMAIKAGIVMILNTTKGVEKYMPLKEYEYPVNDSNGKLIYMRSLPHGLYLQNGNEEPERYIGPDSWRER